MSWLHLLKHFNHFEWIEETSFNLVFEAALLFDRGNHALESKNIILLNLNDLLEALEANLLVVLTRSHLDDLVILELLLDHPVLRDANHEIILRIFEHLVKLLDDGCYNVTVLGNQTRGLSQDQNFG